MRLITRKEKTDRELIKMQKTFMRSSRVVLKEKDDDILRIKVSIYLLIKN